MMSRVTRQSKSGTADKRAHFGATRSAAHTNFAGHKSNFALSIDNFRPQSPTTPYISQSPCRIQSSRESRFNKPSRDVLRKHRQEDPLRHPGCGVSRVHHQPPQAGMLKTPSKIMSSTRDSTPLLLARIDSVKNLWRYKWTENTLS